MKDLLTIVGVSLFHLVTLLLTYAVLFSVINDKVSDAYSYALLMGFVVLPLSVFIISPATIKKIKTGHFYWCN